jgi:translation initiation factor IF-1
LNEEVIHGIPSGRRVLAEGDIVSIDVGASLNGYFGDSAVTLPVGRVSEEAALLLRVTEEALFKAIERTRPGGRLYDIGHAVQQHVEAHGFSVVREFVGHGIGQRMHEEPQVPNYGERTAPQRRHGARDRADGECGQAGGEGAGRWLDGGDPRPQSLGALRAYGGGDGRRAVDTDRERSTGSRAVTGAVTEQLPSALYRVKLDGGGLVTAHIADRLDRNFVRVLVGDRVRIELAPDGGRGRIVEKLSN